MSLISYILCLHISDTEAIPVPAYTGYRVREATCSAILPTCRSPSQWYLWGYLPGYVLVEAALVGEVAHHLRNPPNVIGFLGGSEKPVPLRQSEVNRILGTEIGRASCRERV